MKECMRNYWECRVQKATDFNYIIVWFNKKKKSNSSLLSLLMFCETFAFKNSGRRNQTQSSDGTTCTKGLQGWQQRQQQQGREGDSRPFHGSIYHLWGHEPWHLAHTHTLEHTHTLVASQIAKLRNSCLWQGTYFIQQTACLGTYSCVYAHACLRSLRRCTKFSGVKINIKLISSYYL